MIKVSYAGYSNLSLVISEQFTLEMCAAAENCKKNIKTLFWKLKIIQGYRRWHYWKARH